MNQAPPPWFVFQDSPVCIIWVNTKYTRIIIIISVTYIESWSRGRPRLRIIWGTVIFVWITFMINNDLYSEIWLTLLLLYLFQLYKLYNYHIITQIVNNLDQFSINLDMFIYFCNFISYFLFLILYICNLYIIIFLNSWAPQTSHLSGAQDSCVYE